jgi:hypothetical protein
VTVISLPFPKDIWDCANGENTMCFLSVGKAADFGRNEILFFYIKGLYRKDHGFDGGLFPSGHALAAPWPG